MNVTQEMKAEIEAQWNARAIMQHYQPGTETYAKYEMEFFVGAITALVALGWDAPPVWVINGMSGRPIAQVKEKHREH